MKDSLEKLVEMLSTNDSTRSCLLELKKTTAGIQMSYKLRQVDEVSMGVEFVNKKDYENVSNVLQKMTEKMFKTMETSSVEEPKNE